MNSGTHLEQRSPPPRKLALRTALPAVFGQRLERERRDLRRAQECWRELGDLCELETCASAIRQSSFGHLNERKAKQKSAP